MSTITKRDRSYEVYVCTKRLHFGAKACSEERLPRSVVDDAVYHYFERLALDLNSIKAMATARLKGELADAAERQKDAEGEAARCQARLPEVEADYLRGSLSSESWERFRPRLEEEQDAARAQAEQWQRQRGVLEARISNFDAETAVVEGLARARREVVGELRNAQAHSLDRLRASMRRLFAGFQLSSPRNRFGASVLKGQPWVGNEDQAGLFSLDDGLWLIPYFRYEAMDLTRDDGVGFPAGELSALGDFFHSLLAAW
jgi:hypothetical protein